MCIDISILKMCIDISISVESMTALAEVVMLMLKILNRKDEWLIIIMIIGFNGLVKFLFNGSFL